MNFAEERFKVGTGVMFTNGTGTGKTYSALGVVKRFERRGITDTLILVPSDKIAADWVDAGKNLSLDIHQLAGIEDNGGKKIAVTTYANLYQNKELAKRKWALAIADESHNLMQNKAGERTKILAAFQAMTRHKDGEFNFKRAMLPDLYDELDAASAKAEDLHDRAKTEVGLRRDVFAANEELKRIYRQIEEAAKPILEQYRKDVKTRVVMMSATPFAYDKTVDYAEGYLFEYPKAEGSGYNSGDGQQQFMMQHFGMSMRHNKLNQADTSVDRGLMQRQFNTWLKRERVLSSRMLDIDQDYDRKFVLVDSPIGRQIDEALEYLRDYKRKKSLSPVQKQAEEELSKLIGDQFDYLTRRFVLESIKAREVIPLAQAHLDLGRKVVIYHDYKKGWSGDNPFDVRMTNGSIAAANDAFRSRFPDLIKFPFHELGTALDTLTRAFPDGVVYNGDVPAKKRRVGVTRFNEDGGKANVLIIQSASSAGISLHDTTGKHLRVEFNLGLPTQPTTAIQQEGRIYRVGQKSNAMFRYMNTGTSWERQAFATTIAQRASAAENLALGEQARALLDTFVNGFENSDNFRAGEEGEGTGGRDADRTVLSAISEYDRAKSFYFGTQKKTARNKSREGVDYFSTPEPIGLKMVEFLRLKEGDQVLEPSAGHGAIARWIPENLGRTAIESSAELASRLALGFGGKIVNGSFEDHHISNKYDGIVMNPPFGSSAKTAFEHVQKALGHLREGGRAVALVPAGPAADKRLEAMLNGEDAKGKPNNPGVYLIGDIKMPTVTFERAGTSVSTRIIVLQKGGDGQQITRDYSDAETIKDLFDRIENLDFPIRPEITDVPEIAGADSVSAMIANDSRIVEAEHNRPGRMEAMILQTSQGKLAAGRITQEQFDGVKAKYGEAAAAYESQDKAKVEAGGPKFDRGDRVEYVEGNYKGRHGTIVERHSLTMRSMFGGAASDPTYSYNVKSDNGATLFASPEEIEAEVTKPESVVPDILIGSSETLPHRVYGAWQSAVQSARNLRGKAERAKLDRNRRQAERYAAEQDEIAKGYKARFDVWAEKYPAEAEAIAPKPSPAAALLSGRDGRLPNASNAGDTTGTPGESGGFALSESKHIHTGATVYTAVMETRVSRDAYEALNALAKEHGGYYSKHRNNATGARAGFVFKSAEARSSFVSAATDSGVKFSRSQSAQEGVSQATFAKAVADAFGAKAADRLIGNLIIPLTDQSKLPAHVVPFVRDGDTIYGFYDPKTDKTYAVLSNLDAGMVKGLVLHELGVHYGMERMLGEAKYAQVMKRLDVMASAGNKAVKEARRLAEKETATVEEMIANRERNGFKVDAEKVAAEREALVQEENMAYLVQNHPQLGVVKEIIAAVRAFLYREFGILGDSLTEADLRALAMASVQRAGMSQPGVTGALVTAFHKVWHGSPHDFEQFSLTKIGTGEGAQAYGFGMYFASNKAVAEHYKNALSTPKGIESTTMEKDGKRITGEKLLAEYYVPGEVVRGGGSSYDKVLSYNAKEGSVTVERYVDAALTRTEYGSKRPITYGTSYWTEGEIRGTLLPTLKEKGWKLVAGRLYQVELAPQEDEYLNWDKSLKEQSENVREALEKIGVINYTERELEDFAIDAGPHDEDSMIGKTGEDVYRQVSSMMAKKRGTITDGSLKKDQQAASEYLASIGIPGIRYLDSSSRNKNTVVWKDGADKSQYDRLTQGVVENYLSERGDVADAIVRLKRDANASGQKLYADAAKALESGDIELRLNHNYVIFSDENVKVEAKFARERASQTESPKTKAFRAAARKAIFYQGQSREEAANVSIELARGVDPLDIEAALMRTEWIEAKIPLRERIQRRLAEREDLQYEDDLAAEKKDSTNPDIRFSRAPPIAGSQTTGDTRDSFTAKAVDFTRMLMRSDAKMGWWAKTIGTQQHKAATNSDFRRVYDETQAFISDVSKFANESADEARDLLPRIENFKDFAKKTPTTPEIEQVTQALYAGTLFGGGSPLEGRKWSDEELRTGRANDGPLSIQYFKPLTDRQIGLYRQTLASTELSLDSMAKSLIHKLVRKHDIGFDRNMSLEDVAQIVRDKVDDAIDQKNGRIDALQSQIDDAETEFGDEDVRDAHRRLKREIKTAKKQIAEFESVKDAVTDIEGKTTSLKEHGYFPAMRFGRFAVHVIDQDLDGKAVQKHFGLYESQTKANLAARDLAKEYLGAEIKRFILSQEQYKLFQGLNVDTLEAFAEHITGEDGQPISHDPLVQGFLRAASSERSTMKRHIHRKGTAGFSRDLPRVLASFTVSMARATSSNYHAAEMARLADAVPDGDVKDEAIKLVKYLQDPQEEAQALRGLLFIQFLGGSIAHGMVNMTQPFMVTAPYLTQYTSVADVTKKIGEAMTAKSENLTGKIKEAYERAKLNGVVAPQEIHQLRAETGGLPIGRSLALRKLSFLWGSIYSITEQFNRTTTFLAAYRIAEEKGMADPYEFAINAVNETQFVYNKGNRPNWARGAVGATVFTFKQFSISYLELVKRMYGKDKTAFALMLLMLLAAAGLEGLPFAEDIEDLVDTAGQWMGYATNSKKKLRQWAVAMLGPDLAQVALKGISGVPWMPVDVSVRMGLQNLLPGTSMLKPSESNKGRDVVELLGPVGQFVPTEGTMLGRALERLAHGDYWGAVKSGAPVAIQNVAKGASMLDKGYATDTKGKKITDVSAGEAVLKMAGLQPASVARESDKIQVVRQDIEIQKRTESEIAEKWARGIVDGNPDDIRDARQQLADWNRDNQELRIRVTMPQIARRAQEMRRPRMERFIKLAPPEIRVGVREALR